MALTRGDENELLTALSAGVLESPPWAVFAERLRARLAADLLRLYVAPASATGWRIVCTAAARTGSPLDIDTLGDLDTAGLAYLRDGRVHGRDDLSIPAGGPLRLMRVTARGGASLAVVAARRDRDFSAREGALLGALAPHAAIALETLAMLGAERRRSAIAAWTAGRLRTGWMLLDARGRLVDADPGAAALIAAGHALRRAADGRIRCTFPDAEAALEAALAGQGDAAPPVAAWLSERPPIQIVFLPAPDVDRPAVEPATRLVIVRRLVVPDEAGEGMGLLPRLFGLTRSEALIANRIAAGESISEAAAQLNLTLETARNYTKRIYTKTGARGQAHLVQIILTGVGAFGDWG